MDKHWHLSCLYHTPFWFPGTEALRHSCIPPSSLMSPFVLSLQCKASPHQLLMSLSVNSKPLAALASPPVLLETAGDFPGACLFAPATFMPLSSVLGQGPHLQREAGYHLPLLCLSTQGSPAFCS